jgi:hypothetical protein
VHRGVQPQGFQARIVAQDRAGPATRSPSPARSQYRRATAVHSADTSQHTSRPPAGSARATASDESPVNVPISSASRAPVMRVSSASRPASSEETCRSYSSGSAARVSAISSALSASRLLSCAAT